MLSLIAQADIFGTITPPAGVVAYDTNSGGSIGLILFISNLIKIGAIVAGLYVLFNFITAGYDYITAGDGKAGSKVQEKLTNSIIGIVVIVSSYTVVALISFIFFGDPGYILNPQICGPTGCGSTP